MKFFLLGINKISSLKTCAFIIFLTLTIFSCNSKSEKSNDNVLEYNSENNNPDSYCAIHQINCEKLAKDMSMTIDEYHIWDKKVQSEIEMEDEMTDENGDIVDPNHYNQSASQKQWVNCKNCHGTGYWKCGKCDGTGKLEILTCDYCSGDGCKNCDWSGRKRCYYCEGKGNNGDCPKCDGRGQVLVEF